MAMLLSAAAAMAFVAVASSAGDGDLQREPFQPSSRFLQADSDMQQTLQYHNMYRCMHGVPPLTWDDDIAANAQAWADGGIWGHSPGDTRQINGQGVGENLAWGTSMSGRKAVRHWYDEIAYTDPFGLATGMYGKNGQPIGHYTAVVWKATTKLGCGKAGANVNGNWGTYVVCQYGPHPNIGGAFAENVLAPIKTQAECWQTPAPAPTPPAPAPTPPAPTPPAPNPPAPPAPTPPTACDPA